MIKSDDSSSASQKILGYISDRLCAYQANQPFDSNCRPAESFDEVVQALKLVYRQYIKKGYCPENQRQIYYSPCLFQPDSKIFVYRHGDRIIGTLALIGDSSSGLPMDQLFLDELNQFRKNQGSKLAEVGFLALDLDYFPKKSFSLTNFEKIRCLFALYKLMFDTACLKLKATDLVINVHPKHRLLYEFLAFDAIGPIRYYSDCSKKIALPMRMDIRQVMKASAIESSGRMDYFIRLKIPDSILYSGYSCSAEDLKKLS